MIFFACSFADFWKIIVRKLLNILKELIYKNIKIDSLCGAREVI